MVHVISLLAGKLQPIGGRGAQTGIFKEQVDGPLYLTRSGLQGDQQADLKHHGGPEKALHHYPYDHYPSWIIDLPNKSARWWIGHFGENISTIGMIEKDVSVGDIFRLGRAVVQVSQGRQPCWKLNLRSDVTDMARRVQLTGRTGWYYRVLEEGEIKSGDSLELLERPQPDWSLERLWRALYVDRHDTEELQQMKALPQLADSWRDLASRRLVNKKTEDWSRRLNTPRASGVGERPEGEEPSAFRSLPSKIEISNKS